MSDSNYNTTKEDIRNAESEVSQKNNGNVPSESEPSQMKGIIDQNSKPKSEIIEERKSNLPLPDQPPVASDWKSSDASKVNVGSGGEPTSGESYGGDVLGAGGPVTGDSANSGVGRQGHDGLDDLPKDARAR